MTKDGGAYAIQRYKDLVQERYFISKQTNTSYEDVGKMTPTERMYIIKFISDEIKRQNEIVEKHRAESKQRNKHKGR